MSIFTVKRINLLCPEWKLINGIPCSFDKFPLFIHGIPDIDDIFITLIFLQLMTSDHFLMIQVVECFIFYRLIQIDTDRFMWVQRFPDIPHISKYILNKILRNRLRACKSPAEIAEQIVVGQEKIFKRILIPLPYGLHTLFFVMLVLVFHIVLSLCSERLYKKPVLPRSEEHTSELQSRGHLVCRLLLEKKKPLYSSTHRI